MKIRLRDGTGTVNLKYLVEDVDRHGNVRIYLRRQGRKVRLRETPGTEKFIKEYREAMAHGPAPVEQATAARRGSLRWLVERYYASAEFKGLAESTRRVRRGILDGICEVDGDKPFARMERRHVHKIRDEKAEFPEAANGRLKALRQVFKCAVKIGHAENNPTAGVEKINSNNPDGIHTWTEEEVEQYEACHPVGTPARLALALILLGGGARCSDVHRLGRQHMRNGRLRYTQFKNRNRTPVEVDIPILPALQEIFDATPCGDLALIVSAYGRPYASAASFGNRMKKWTAAAGIPHCSAHGLHKVSASRLAEIGLTDHEIMSFNGWTSLRQVQNYTKGARRRVMADNAAIKIEQGQESNKSVPLSQGSDGSGTKRAKKS